jgi:hypothetical protein
LWIFRFWILDSDKDAAEMDFLRVWFAWQLIGFTAGVAGAVEIHLNAEAHCPGPLVRLGDIAEIESPALTDHPSLADLALFPAPPAGKSRKLARQDLRQWLAWCDVDPGEVEISGAETVVIHGGSNDTKTIIRPALHLIPAQAYIKSGPARPQEKSAAAGEPESPARLVSRNQAVTIHSIWPGVKVTAQGKALADASLGESILVEQESSRERVLAKVIAPQTVEVRPATK